MKTTILKTFKKGRPTFYYNNDPHNQIRAAGLIFYRVTPDKTDIEYLMIKWNGKYEDFGGKTDKEDECYQDTALRETIEESNGILNLYSTFYPVMNSEPLFYKKCKYVTYILKTNINYNPIDFGDMEYYENVARTVEWVSYSKLTNRNFTKKKLHTRLHFRGFFNKLKEVYNKEIKKYTHTNISQNNTLIEK